MNKQDILNKTCLIGLRYYDTDGNTIKQQQHAGKVENVDDEKGISIRLIQTKNSETIASDGEGSIFVIPPLLSPWFKAPAGSYKDSEGNLLIENPDFFVTWDIHKTQEEKEGDHEWWEWQPCTIPPRVN